MKTFVSTILLIFSVQITVLAQSREDSIKLKADIEAIRQGKTVKSTDKKSVLRVDDTLTNPVDTNALKPNLPRPTPPSPNNPNPHSPRPSVVHPSPPATPPEDPIIPPGAPKGPNNPPEKKD